MLERNAECNPCVLRKVGLLYVDALIIHVGLRWLWHGFAFSGSGMESLFCRISCLSRGVRGCVGAAAGLYEWLDDDQQAEKFKKCEMWLKDDN